MPPRYGTEHLPADKESRFTAFVEDERDWLGRLAVMLIGDRHAAEDLLQETLVRTYLAWDRIEEATAFAYARRVMTNLATDRWRRSRRDPLSGHEAESDTDPQSGDQYSSVDDRDAIVRQLAGLSTRERTMVVLRYYADLSEAEVAEEMGVSRGTVKSTCSRALSRLRSQEPQPTESPR
ncbi:SigE family RNA polymerase sigma factor [Luteococcus sp. H138]|uniref:SigE family RNA polymerase sigma factor n=1 Tax=unclassified Luteococcus TaxID=2639923 RepID=UPI00313EE1D0